MSRFSQPAFAAVAVVVLAAVAYILMGGQPEEPRDTAPPVAVAGDDVSVLVGESFTLDGSGSVNYGTISGFECARAQC